MLGLSLVEIQVDFSPGLRGVLHRPASRKRRPAVVLLHGFSGSRIEQGRLFVRLGRALAACGIACLRFDFRGSGDSDGEFQDMTLASEVADARAALGWLRRRAGIDRKRIGLLGMSLGSVVAQLVAADERVRSLSLWAPITRPAEVFATDLGVGARGFAAGTQFWIGVRAAQPLPALARYRGPLLCIRGDSDYVPEENAADVLKTVPGILHTIRGGDHTFGPHEKKDEAIEVTRRFFAQSLEAEAAAAKSVRSAAKRSPPSRR
jgi:pimeloyl-ACP methyl ester carboxylesterase